MRSIAGVFALFILVQLSFCSPVFFHVSDCGATESAPISIAMADSASVAAFLGLPDDTINERREQAEQLLKQAEKETNGPARRILLRKATNADPAGYAERCRPTVSAPCWPRRCRSIR